MRGERNVDRSVLSYSTTKCGEVWTVLRHFWNQPNLRLMMDFVDNFWCLVAYWSTLLKYFCKWIRLLLVSCFNLLVVPLMILRLQDQSSQREDPARSSERSIVLWANNHTSVLYVHIWLCWWSNITTRQKSHTSQSILLASLTCTHTHTSIQPCELHSPD